VVSLIIEEEFDNMTEKETFKAMQWRATLVHGFVRIKSGM